MFHIIEHYYQDHGTELQQLGFRKKHVHIKTNLYNFDRHEALLRQHQVSISASIDLPLKLHDQYRRSKTGKSTLKRILQQLQRLADYPHRKKLSATLFAPHIARTEHIIADIRAASSIRLRHESVQLHVSSSR